MSAATVSPAHGAILSPRVGHADAGFCTSHIKGAATGKTPRRALVRRTVAEWRQRHPELRGVVTFEALCAVLEREGIWLHTRDYRGRLGCAIALPLGPDEGDGATRCIILHEELTGPARLFVLAHELGHHALHLTPAYLRSVPQAPVRRRWGEPLSATDRTDNDRKEAEADLFAERLLGFTRECVESCPLELAS